MSEKYGPLEKYDVKLLVDLLYDARTYIKTSWSDPWVIGWIESVRRALLEDEGELGMNRSYRVREQDDGLFEISYQSKPDRWLEVKAKIRTVRDIPKDEVDKTLRELTRKVRARDRYMVIRSKTPGKRLIYDMAPKLLAEVDEAKVKKKIRKLMEKRDG